MPDYLLIPDKQKHQRPCQKIADKKNEDSVNDFQNHAAAKALPHSLFLPCALVLRHQRRHRMRDILLRRVGKIINPVDHGKRSRHRDSHRIDDRLNADLSKLYRRLLHR